jgi:asparagine synthase (glutamine-hydrolysing)
MSVQFGRWNFEGQPPAPDYFEKVSATLAPFGPDSNEFYSKGNVRILYRAFHTTKESRDEKQPWICPSGAVITWDGRLDNRADLISALLDSATINSTDVSIVAAAYEKWGANCLGKLIGDWALSIWNPREHSVLLAKDPIGTKHLYYSFDDKQLTWSTILDPLVLFAGRTFEICGEYIAGWFATMYPAAHLTPYVGIHAVPPCSSVLLQAGKHTIGKYWNFDHGKHIRYRTDGEYEEHFRTVFATALQRRLRSDHPILGELSGGMDSSSIVCMADTIIARGTAVTPRLDTISWYDDSYDHIEPDWNERPYFTKVEEKRGRPGHHINIRELTRRETGTQRSFAFEFENGWFAVTPDASRDHHELFKQYSALVRSQGYRVTLSGIGGDDVMGGGVPTPMPEFQNLMARARFVTLAHQLNAWAAKMRKHRLPLLWEASRRFITASLPTECIPIAPAPWFDPAFVRRNHAALRGYPFRVKLFGPLPSFQDNIGTLNLVRRFVTHCVRLSEPVRDVRFPYFDRTLLEFMYAIPREQIVRTGQRRSLMKRALIGIVPNELLNRHRKAFVPPEPSRNSSMEWPGVDEVGQRLVSSSVGIVDGNRFLEALQKARRNEEVSIGSLKRTLKLESWLRHLTIQGVLTNAMATERQRHLSSLEAKTIPKPVQPKSSAS